MTINLGNPIPITKHNEDHYTEAGLPINFSFFYQTYPDAFQSKTLRFKHLSYFLLIAACGALLYSPAYLKTIAELIQVQTPEISDLTMRIGAGIAIVVLLIGRFIAETTQWTNKASGGKMKSILTFHHITQWRFNAQELQELFEQRDFKKLFKLEEDEGSNIFLHAEEDKKGKMICLMLGEFDNYRPLPMTKIAVISGAEYDELCKIIPRN